MRKDRYTLNRLADFILEDTFSIFNKQVKGSYVNRNSSVLVATLSDSAYYISETEKVVGKAIFGGFTLALANYMRYNSFIRGRETSYDEEASVLASLNSAISKSNVSTVYLIGESFEVKRYYGEIKASTVKLILLDRNIMASSKDEFLSIIEGVVKKMEEDENGSQNS